MINNYLVLYGRFTMIDALENFLQWTSWPMKTPEIWGVFHMTFLAVGLMLTVAVCYLLKDIDDKKHDKVILAIGIFLAVIEIYKQLYYYFVVGQRSYQYWVFPFQLCSIPIYLCLIIPFVKKEKLKQAMYDFLVYFNFLGGLAAFVEPSGIVHDRITLTLHSYTWHMMLIFIGAFLVVTKKVKADKKSLFNSFKVFLVLAVVAFAINCLLWQPSNGSINMFFVGPANSSLVVFKDIARKYGWYVSTLLYLPTVCLGATLMWLPIHFIQKKNTQA